jgi:putative aminopeptidase FrvX
MKTQINDIMSPRLATAARRTLPAALVAVALGVSGGAFAQAQGGQGQSGGYAPPQQQAAEVTDKQLGQFMVAMASVQDVQEQYAGEIQSASDAEKSQKLRQEAQSEMISAVEDSGLSVQEYNTIAQQLRADPELAERAKAMQE